jgi:hypothetical protein
MDGSRFDALTRLVERGTKRRQLLRSLGVGVLGGLGRYAVPETEATLAAGKGCRENCGPCATCQPGKCKRKHGKKKCKAGACVPRADDSSCDGSGRCLNGVCNPRPTCAPRNENCIPDGDCCSGICAYFDMALNYCEAGPADTPCYDGDDCESASCVGYRCQ